MAKKKRDREPAVKKPAPVREPVYTVMAFVTLVAIALGCTLLYLDFDDYGQKTAPDAKVPTLPKLGEEAKTGPAAAPMAPAAPAGPGVPAAPMAPAPGN